MEIFVTIAEKVGEIAIDQVINEISLLSHVRDDLHWIQIQMGNLQSYLKDAEAKQVRTEGVSNFIRNIWDLAYDVEDIIDTYFPKMRLSGNRWKRLLNFRNMRIVHDFVKEVECIRKRVENLRNDRQGYGIDESSCSNEGDTWDPRKTFPHLDDPNVVGFDNLIKTLVDEVINEDSHHRVVSIIGFAGLGKTTLAKKVYNSARESKAHNSDQQRFDCAAWVCVSESPNVKMLLRDIARNVGLEKEKIENDVEANLFAFLSTKRYVIVIDDIWHTEAWDALKIGIPLNSENGSRIILTSRNTEVGTYVGGQNSIRPLEPLDLETSTILFYKLIVDGLQNCSETNDPPELESIGDKILEKCGGVPLAIVLVAGLLKSRKRSESAWEGVLAGLGQDNDKCAQIFSLSYRDLPLNLKPCFLYFGIFPEDYEVEAFDLINIWAAEGFIRGSRGREVEEVGDDYLNHLIARNLVQVVQTRYDGRARSVRIHDIMHNLCIQEANKINFFHVLSNDTNLTTTLKVRRFTVHRGDSSASYRNTSSLRGVFCLVSPNPLNIKDHKNSRYLRVLSVNQEYKKLPRYVLANICNLRHLTYLKLVRSWVELPYAISNLKRLLTLDLGECIATDVPDVIWSMKQLRHILLPLYNQTCSPHLLHSGACRCISSCEVNLDGFRFYPVEINLPNLQTLQWLSGYFFKTDQLEKLTTLKKLGVKLSNKNKDTIGVLSDQVPKFHKLEELSLRGPIGASDHTISLNLSQYNYLSELSFGFLKLNELSHDKLPPNLTKLSLRSTWLTTDPMVALSKLQKLKFLELGSGSYLGKELICSGEPGNFPSLEEFEIRYLEDVELVVIKEEGMPRLRKLTIFGLYRDSRGPDTQVPDRVKNVMSFTRGQRKSPKRIDEDEG